MKRFSVNNKEKVEGKSNNIHEDANAASTRNTTTIEFLSKENIKKGGGESRDVSSSSDSKYSHSEGNKKNKGESRAKKKADQEFEGSLLEEHSLNPEKSKRSSEKSSINVIDEETGQLLSKTPEEEIQSSTKMKKDNSYNKIENIKFLADIAPNN